MNALGWGTNGDELTRIPRAVELSSSSSSSLDGAASEAVGPARRNNGSRGCVVMSSLELVITRSDSLELSSYSSWLLLAPLGSLE